MEDLNIRGEMEAAAAELEAQGQDFETDASPDASPAPDQTPNETQPEPEGDGTPPAPATEEPTPPAEPESPTPDEDELPIGGSIPVPRVRKIIANARAKAAAEAKAEAEKLRWAADLSQEEATEAVRIIRYANERPIEFMEELMGRLKASPMYAAEVTRRFAQAAPSAEPAPDPDPKPAPDVLLEDGRMVYSAAQLEKYTAWMEKRLDARVAERVKPMEQDRELRRLEQSAAEQAKQVMAEVQTWPGMDDPENRKAVANVMITERLNVDAAYRKVVVPKFAESARVSEDAIRRKVLEELKTKARATTENPQRVIAPAESFKGKTIREILEATADELGMRD